MQLRNASQAQPEFWAVLGGVRFGLAGIVLCRHLVGDSTPSWLLHQMVKLSASTAVFCFLVISGFSIAHSLERNREHFYRRRLLRIYPLYVAAILIGVLVARLPGSPIPVHPTNVVANLLFLQTFATEPLPANAVVWSLALEVACYAMAPLFHRMRSRTLLMMTVGSGVAFVLYPVVLGTGYFSSQRGFALLVLGWAWLGGFLFHRHRHNPVAGVLLLGGMIALTSMNQFFAESWQHLTVVGSIGLLVAGEGITVRPAVRQLLDYLGDLSYPLYLMHVPVFVLFKYILHSRHHGPAVICAVALSMAMLRIEPQLRAVLTTALDRAGDFIGQLRQRARQSHSATNISLALASS